mgnify:CR=1 FL=1
MTSTPQPVRCPWGGIGDPEYARYHDEEWGVPMTDDRALLEKLVLEGFQSGLSWLTILKKRDNFRRAFHGFEATRIARYTEKDRLRLMADAGIVAPLRFAAVLADGETIYAFRYSSDERPPTLYFNRCEHGTIVASEPLQDRANPCCPEWVAVAADSALIVRGASVETRPLHVASVPVRRAA